MAARSQHRTNRHVPQRAPGDDYGGARVGGIDSALAVSTFGGVAVRLKLALVQVENPVVHSPNWQDLAVFFVVVAVLLRLC